MIAAIGIGMMFIGFVGVRIFRDELRALMGADQSRWFYLSSIVLFAGEVTVAVALMMLAWKYLP